MVATGNPRGQGRSWSCSTEETSAYWNKFEGGEKDSRQSDSGLSGRLILKDDQRSDQSTDLTPTHTEQSADEDLAVGVEQIFLRLLRGLPMEHWRYWYWVWWISTVGGRYVFPGISWCICFFCLWCSHFFVQRSARASECIPMALWVFWIHYLL